MQSHGSQGTSSPGTGWGGGLPEEEEPELPEEDVPELPGGVWLELPG